MKNKFINILYEYLEFSNNIISNTYVFNACDMEALQKRNIALKELNGVFGIQKEITRRLGYLLIDFKFAMTDDYGGVKEAILYYKTFLEKEKIRLKEFVSYI